MAKRRGSLVVIGGAEDREGHKLILSSFTSLCGKKPHIVVLTTASRLAGEQAEVAKEFEELYENAFRDCGASFVETLHIHDRHAASDPEMVAAIDRANGVFLTGGSQDRLVAILGGTPVAGAMSRLLSERSGCIGGTSAGASALSEHMLLGGPSDRLPLKNAMPMSAGLGFLRHVVIDQHFYERQRLSRLLSVLAQTPFLIGIGIDEDTAMVVEPGGDFEVIGSGAVTLLDARNLTYSSLPDASDGDPLALTDIQLHLLPAGFKYRATGTSRGHNAPEAACSETFRELMATLASGCTWHPGYR